MWIMGPKALVHLPALLICLFISNDSLVAQSKDRINPTPLQSPTISGFTSPIGVVYWYKLTAGPGELVIEMQVEGISNMFGRAVPSGARFVLYDGAMEEVIDEALFTSAAVERKKKSITLQGKQDFLMSIMLGEGMHLRDKAGGTYMIRFKGAIDLPPEGEER
jgi:hypothetical protein